MKIALLGSGNVATHLSKALIKAGHSVEQVWSRNPNHAVDLALEIGANSIIHLQDISQNIDVIIIAVSDDGIEKVVSQIPVKDKQLLLHTSGSTGLEVLKKQSKYCGVLYPLQTFTKSADIDFSVVPICIEANSKETLEWVSRLAHQLSKNVQEVNSENRALLHISAVFACNFSNHLYVIAQQILEKSNLSFDLLRPLIKETADKALLNLPSTVQTGPAKRVDKLTMDKHLSTLQQYPNWQKLYKEISQDIVKMYQSPPEDK